MPVSKDPEIFKLLVGLVGICISIIGSFIIKMLYSLKSTDEKIFTRLNKTDSKVTRQVAICEERHKNDKNR